MEKEINVKFSIKDIFKAFGELMWKSDEVMDENEELPKELKAISDKLTKRAEALTNVKLSKSKAKSQDAKFTKNVQKTQISNNKQFELRSTDKKDREREE